MSCELKVKFATLQTFRPSQKLDPTKPRKQSPDPHSSAESPHGPETEQIKIFKNTQYPVRTAVSIVLSLSVELAHFSLKIP